MVSGENQESNEDLITSFGVPETIQSQFKDVQPFKETSQTVAKESDTSTRVSASSATSSNDVISGFDLKPGDKPGTSQYKCSDRPGILRMKLSKENWKRLAENGTNLKEDIETKSSKEFLVDETPENQNGPIMSFTSEEMVTGSSPIEETGNDFTHLNQSGQTSSKYKSYSSEKNLKLKKNQDRPHLSGKCKSHRQDRSKSGESFVLNKMLLKHILSDYIADMAKVQPFSIFTFDLLSPVKQCIYSYVSLKLRN